MKWYLHVIKNYANSDGRASRKEFWMFILFNFIFSLIAAMVGLAIISTIYGLFVLIPSITVAIRRMHDIGKSGWWVLIGFIPAIGWIWLIILAATASDVANEYGPVPTEIEG